MVYRVKQMWIGSYKLLANISRFNQAEEYGVAKEDRRRFGNTNRHNLQNNVWRFNYRAQQDGRMINRVFSGRSGRQNWRKIEIRTNMGAAKLGKTGASTLVNEGKKMEYCCVTRGREYPNCFTQTIK